MNSKVFDETLLPALVRVTTITRKFIRKRLENRFDIFLSPYNDDNSSIIFLTVSTRFRKLTGTVSTPVYQGWVLTS